VLDYVVCVQRLRCRSIEDSVAEVLEGDGIGMISNWLGYLIFVSSISLALIISQQLIYRDKTPKNRT
jgi:hypothetical protein